MFYVQMCSSIAYFQVRQKEGYRKYLKIIDIIWNISFIFCLFFYFNKAFGWNILNVSDNIYDIILIGITAFTSLFFILRSIDNLNKDLRGLRKTRDHKKLFTWSIVSLPIAYVVTLLFGLTLSIVAGFNTALTVATMAVSLQMPLVIVELFFYNSFRKRQKEFVEYHGGPLSRTKYDEYYVKVAEQNKFKSCASILPIIIEVAMAIFVIVFLVMPLVQNVDISAIKGSLPKNLLKEGSLIGQATELLLFATTIIDFFKKNLPRKKKEKKND